MDAELHTIPQLVAQHWDIIEYMFILGLFAAVGELRWAIHKLMDRQDEFIRACAQCQKDIVEHYVTWDSLTGPEGIITDIKKDRKHKWEKQDELNRQRERVLARINTRLEIED